MWLELCSDVCTNVLHQEVCLFRFFRKVRSGGGSKDVKVVKNKQTNKKRTNSWRRLKKD
jgi:hypothetical protein